ncbi:hypothetical protein [Ekhidna sp.]
MALPRSAAAWFTVTNSDVTIQVDGEHLRCISGHVHGWPMISY